MKANEKGCNCTETNTVSDSFYSSSDTVHVRSDEARHTKVPPFNTTNMPSVSCGAHMYVQSTFNCLDMSVH